MAIPLGPRWLAADSEFTNIAINIIFNYPMIYLKFKFLLDKNNISLLVRIINWTISIDYELTLTTNSTDNTKLTIY